jgi:hypothetical protein
MGRLASLVFGVYAIWMAFQLFGCETVMGSGRVLSCAPGGVGVVPGWLAGIIALAIGLFFALGALASMRPS